MSRRAGARSGVVLTVAGRAVCRAVGTTAWAVLADIVLDAETDAHGNLVATTNVRRIADNLGMSKDTAARALARLVDAGLVVRHCRRGPGGEFDRSRYEVRLNHGDGITVVATAPGPPSPCPVLDDTGGDTQTEPDTCSGAGVKHAARLDGTNPGPRRGQRRARPDQDALFELSADAGERR